MSDLKEAAVLLLLIAMLITAGVNGAKLTKLLLPTWQTNSGQPVEPGFDIGRIAFPR